MTRISIDVSPEEHQRLKAMAALQGQSIKQFVLTNTLERKQPDEDAAGALAELEALLNKRLAGARSGRASTSAVGDLIEQLRQEAEGLEPNG